MIKLYKKIALITELKSQQDKFLPVDWTSLRSTIAISYPGASLEKEQQIDLTDIEKLKQEPWHTG